MLDPDVTMDYLDFVRARHRVWELRRAGDLDYLREVEDDRLREALSRYSFTNVFRILDTGSQFVARELLWGDDERERDLFDNLVRVALYRLTNLPEPWVFYKQRVGRYPIADDLLDGTLGRVLRAYEGPILRQAYYLHTTGTHPDGSVDRRTWLTWWAETYLDPGRPGNVAQAFIHAETTQERVEALKGAVRVGDFLAMQMTDDLSWSRHYPDGPEYVVPGPGARWGAAELDPGRPAEAVMAEVHELLLDEGPRLSVRGRELPVRLMDTQNTLCEFSKLAKIYRGAGKRRFVAAHPGVLPAPFYPPHW